MNRVMDASALIAYLRGEQGADEVEAVLLDDNSDCYVHVLNLCEVYYDFHREEGMDGAERALDILTSTGLGARGDLGGETWKQAAVYKAELRRVSLADCFCLSLANRLGAEVVTADRHEFEAVTQLAICPIRFIR